MKEHVKIVLDFGEKDIERYYCDSYSQSEESQFLIMHTLDDMIVGINLEAIKSFKIVKVNKSDGANEFSQ